MKMSLIPLSARADWEGAVANVRHGPSHTYWYNAALAKSLADDIALLTYQDGDDCAVCPLLLRRFGEFLDVATPYGFGGFATRGVCDGLPFASREFAKEQGWVCGYFALHPLFENPYKPDDGLVHAQIDYFLSLDASESELLAGMHKNHRNEIRRSLDVDCTIDSASASAALPPLYAETLNRVGAGNDYRFTDATLRDWVASPGCLVAAAGEPVEAIVVCLYTVDVADYFISACSPEARKYTRLLLWRAICELKLRGVSTFNFAGGVRKNDALDAFKRRFGGVALAKPVLKQVYNPQRFAALCLAANADQDAHYFPPYRATALGASK